MPDETTTADPHAEGYRVDLEIDPLRQMAHLLSDFIAQEQLQRYNHAYTTRALAGDPSQLLTNVRVGLAAIRAQLERDPGTIINGWTAGLMQAVKEWPDAR